MFRKEDVYLLSEFPADCIQLLMDKLCTKSHAIMFSLNWATILMGIPKRTILIWLVSVILRSPDCHDSSLCKSLLEQK